MFYPAIIIPCYNRPKSLIRLLTALENSDYISDVDVTLVFSIDYSGENDVYKIAKDYIWSFGEKRIITHEKNIGLRANIISCGDLTKEFQSVIIIEDDIFVSKSFYKYAFEAINFFDKEKNVAGISLYNYSINEYSKLPFYPMENDDDAYFMQFPSSWGQVWTKNMWTGFKRFLESAPNLNEFNIPPSVKKWPDSSWKKFFCAYLVASDKYFVFPKISQSTNFADSGGTHNFFGTNLLQTPIGEKYRWKFPSFSESKIKYDAYSEINFEYFKGVNDKLNLENVLVDLNGVKENNYILKDYDYILTSKKASQGKPIKTYGAYLKPIENNIIYDIEGDQIKLYKIDSDIKFSFTDISLSYYYSFSIFRILSLCKIKVVFLIKKLIFRLLR